MYTEEDLNVDIELLINQFDADSFKDSEIFKRISSNIKYGSIKLLNVVLKLQDNMISEDDLIRKQALECLNSIISHLDHDTLVMNDIKTILSFYQTKLHDFACVKETLCGIDILVKMKEFSLDQIVSILNMLKFNYLPEDYLASTRYYSFSILNNLFERFRDFILEDDSINNLFIEVFVKVATGEKDPRNLLISFELNFKISTQLNNITLYREALFDVLFCYFPITFRPPKDDPYNISNQDLKLSLRSAISSTPLFDDDAFGNLLEKLTASSPNVKNDTVLTLKACLDNFGGESCSKHWSSIWDAIQFEIMNYEEDNTIQSDFNNYHDFLSVISSISLQLISFQESEFDKFFHHIFGELEPNFRSERNINQTCGILSTVASIDNITFEKVINKVLPLIFENCNDSTLSKQKIFMLNLSFFLDAYINVFNRVDIRDQGILSSANMKHYKDSVIMNLSKGLMTTSKNEITLRTLAINNFIKLVEMPNFLSYNEILLIIQYLMETILTDDNKDIYLSCIKGLNDISKNYTSSVCEVSLKLLFDILPPDSNCNIQLQYDTTPEKIIKIILDITRSKDILIKESIHNILKKLFQAGKSKDNEEYCFLLISALYLLFSNEGNLLDETFFLETKKQFESVIINTMINCNSIYMDDHNLELLSFVMFFINIQTSRMNHQEELERYIKLFIQDFKILDTPKRSISIFVNLVAGLDTNCNFKDHQLILANTISLLINKDLSRFERLCYLKLVALISNKWCSDDDILSIIDFENNSEICLEILAWAGKGLAMKNSYLSSTIIDKLAGLLNDSTIGSFVASLFEILMIDIPLFSKFKGTSWHINIRLLYKQKLFDEIAAKLIKLYKSGTIIQIKSNYLMALSFVLKNTSSNITSGYMCDLFPLLLQALELDNNEVRISALQSLKGTVQQSSKLIIHHIHSLIPLLLDMVSSSSYNSATIKILSLDLLKLLPSYLTVTQLLPFKDDIIAGLNGVLDDKRRKVRKNCIDARQIYFELDSVVDT